MAHKNNMHEKGHLVAAWMLRHELLASCCITLALGAVIGGGAIFLEWLLV